MCVGLVLAYVMNSDKSNCTTCAKGVLWDKGGSVGGHSEGFKVLCEGREQCFNGRTKGDTIESESK